MDEAVRRVVEYAKKKADHLIKMSAFAYVVWPGAKFLSTQGAALAVSKIVHEARKQGFLEWQHDADDWGYRWTRKTYAVE